MNRFLGICVCFIELPVVAGGVEQGTNIHNNGLRLLFFSNRNLPVQEGVNGVNRQTTKSEKYY